MHVDVVCGNRLASEQIAEWSALQRADKTFDNPFFRPELLSVAADVCEHVEVAVIKQDGKSVGFFGFERDRHNVGRPITTAFSDLHGVVIRKDVEWDAAELIRQAGLSAWHFDHLIASQKPFLPYHQFVDDSPYIDLREGFEEYRAQRRKAGSSAIRQAERKARKMAKELGPLRFEAHTSDRSALTALVDWKRNQLNRQGHVDLFRLNWVTDLLEAICVISGEDFLPLLSTLYAGERLVAVHLGLRSHQVLSSWIPAYDEELAKYSPGLVLHVELTKWAATAGIERIDLCRGENQLKSSLMSGAFPVAIGSVDLRPIRHVLTKGYFCIRNLIHATPLRGVPLKTYRRIRSWISRC